MNYFNNEEMLALLIDYKETRSKKAQTKICRELLKLVQKILMLPNFSNYTIDRKSEMGSNAIYFMYRYLDNFDCYTYKNPHAYFTTICWRAFLQTINKYKKTSKTFLPLDFIENICNSDDFNLNNQFKEINSNMDE